MTDESQASKDTIIVTMSCPKQLTAIFTPGDNDTSTGWIQKVAIGIGIAASVGLVLFLTLRLVIKKRIPPKVV